MGKQLDLPFESSEQCRETPAEIVHKLQTLPERELMSFLIAQGMTTAEKLMLELKKCQFGEGGEQSNYYTNIAQIANRDRSYYVDIAKRVCDGRAENYEDAKIQFRNESVSISLREEYEKRFGTKKPKPR